MESLPLSTLSFSTSHHRTEMAVALALFEMGQLESKQIERQRKSSSGSMAQIQTLAFKPSMKFYVDGDVTYKYFQNKCQLLRGHMSQMH